MFDIFSPENDLYFVSGFDLNYRDNGYIPEKELQRDMEILFASLDQIVTIT